MRPRCILLRPRALLAKEHILYQEVVAFPALGMETVWNITVKFFASLALRTTFFS
jgi:tartrate dehydratase beta subunit/fumarate hydratase class I family protein